MNETCIELSIDEKDAKYDSHDWGEAGQWLDMLAYAGFVE